MSVVAITYNHETFVRECLDGLVAQKAEYPVEIIVADDASTDATPAIICEYARRYPNRIRPILRSENIGPHGNATHALSSARGEYLALCEGDDYWTDSMKLSKQVAFLDMHPQTAVCFHPVRVVWSGGEGDSTLAQAFLRKLEQAILPEFPPFFWAGDLSLETLLSRNFIQTNSVMYRKLPSYDDIPANIMPMDWYLHLRHAASGDIAMLPETMGVYRRHAHGIWHDATVNPAKFWLAHGPAHMALLEATLELFPDDPVHEEIVAKNAHVFLGRMAKYVPGPEGRALLLDTVAQHPRLAALALQHRRRQTVGVRLKSWCRFFAASALNLRARRTPTASEKGFEISRQTTQADSRPSYGDVRKSARACQGTR